MFCTSSATFGFEYQHEYYPGNHLTTLPSKKMIRAALLLMEWLCSSSMEGTHVVLQCVSGPLATSDARKLFMSCVRCRARTAAGLRQRLAKSSIFHKWVKCEGLKLWFLQEWNVARWMQCQSSLSKICASRALAALRWVATVFDVDLHLSSSLVSHRSHALDHSQRLPPSTLARCPTVEMTVHWEAPWLVTFLPLREVSPRRCRFDSRDVTWE